MYKKVYLIIGIILTFSLSGCGKNQQPQPVSGNSMSAVSQPSVSCQTTDPVFYGEAALWLEKDNTISVNLEVLDYFDALDRVCVFNSRTKKEEEFPVSGEFKYTAEEDGTYYVYAVTLEGKYVDLSKNLGVTQIITTGSNGFIGL